MHTTPTRTKILYLILKLFAQRKLRVQDRYGTEVALQIHWAAQQLHPALFSETDMVAWIRDFYQRFFDYPLSDAEAHLILLGFAPGRD